MPLTSYLTEIFKAHGRMTFARFMGEALYHPTHGYYSSGRVSIGEGADFVTAPHLGPLFARCLANLVIRADLLLGSPDPFVLVEGGPGEGILALGILDAVRADSPALYGRLRYAPAEVSPALAERQANYLAPHRDRVVGPAPEGYTGLYLSNELVDALPFHRMEVADGILGELYVTLDGSGFAWEFGPPSTPEVEKLAREAVERIVSHSQGGGFRFEVSPAALSWLGETASMLGRGFIVTVDYGDVTRKLYGPAKPEGSARGYGGGMIRGDLLGAPGSMDLTCSVDFSALALKARELGLSALGPLNQREFLFSLGLADEVAKLEEALTSEVERIELRMGLHPLLMPGTGMGETFKALALGKGTGEEALEELLPLA